MRYGDEGEGEEKGKQDGEGVKRGEKKRLQGVKGTVCELCAFPLLLAVAEFRFSHKSRACLTR